MANNFYECVKNGGKVTNRRTEGGQKITLCYDNEGKSHTKKKFKKQVKEITKVSLPTQESLQQLIIHFNQTNKIN